MRAILFGLLLLSLSTPALAQGAKRFIFWSGDPNCGVKSRAITSPETVVCGQIATPRGPVNTVMYDGVAIAAAFLEDDDRLIVGVRITNTTDEFIGFDSDLWGAAHFNTKAGFYAGEKPIAAETSIPSRDLIRTLARETKLENIAGNTIAEMQMTAETQRVRRPDGTVYIRTTIVPDKEARETERRSRTNRTENLTTEQRRLRESALTAKSVPANGSVDGLVYFRRYKKANFVVYSLNVDGTTFVFQLPKIKH